MFRFDAANLEFKHDVAAQTKVEEQQIDEEVLRPDRQPVLPSDEGEPVTELGEEVRHPGDQGVFQLPLGVPGSRARKSKS